MPAIIRVSVDTVFKEAQVKSHVSTCKTAVLRVLCITNHLCFPQLLCVVYDPQYALRLCTEHKLTRASVLIYAAMGLYEESVDHALMVSEAPTILYKYMLWRISRLHC